MAIVLVRPTNRKLQWRLYMLGSPKLGPNGLQPSSVFKSCAGVAVKDFRDEFADLSKVPDFIIRPDDCPLPSVVVETAVSESKVQLIHRDKRIWVEGAFPYVKVVFAVNFIRHRKGTVTGDLRVW